MIEIAEAVFWLRLPLPMKLDHVNIYVLDDGDGLDPDRHRYEIAQSAGHVATSFGWSLAEQAGQACGSHP